MDWIREWKEFHSDLYDFRFSNITYNHPIYHSLHAIDEIIKKYPPPYTLMASGGIDSQAMIYAWLLSKVKFNVLSIKYVSDNILFNYHDLKNLELYRKKFNFDLRYKEFEILEFYDNEFYQIADKYQCSSPQICSHIYNILQVEEGTVIQSGNFLGINQVPLNNPILSLHRLAKSTNRLVPFFFLSSPNLAYSAHTFLKQNRNLESYNKKIRLYTDTGFEVIPAERSFSGFEKIKEYYQSNFSKNLSLTHRLKAYPNPSKQVFDILLRFPLMSKYDTKNVIFYTNAF